jgi:hypothetical protein
MGQNNSKKKRDKTILVQQYQQPVQVPIPSFQTVDLLQTHVQRPIQGPLEGQDPFDYFFQKYQISPYYRNDLMTLNQFDIILILDDSGSMATQTDHGKTRWSELLEMSYPIIELASLLDADGLDIIFLNRGYRANVRSTEHIQDLLVNQPHGRTPLSMRVREAMKLYKGKPQLIIIMTDGEPSTTDYKTDPDYDSVQLFRQVLEYERNPDLTFVSILKCSNNDNETGYLDKMDKELTNLDVIDDYFSERSEVLQKQGPNFQYTPGDNIARLLLGSIYPKYDKMDEKFIE